MPSSTNHASNNRSFYKNILRPLLFFVGFTFFVILIVRSWSETQLILQTLNWPLFILSILIAVMDNVLFSFLFQQLLTKYGFHIAYPQTGQMFFYGQMAKYIPGRFWSVFYHSTFLQRTGATKTMLFTNLDLTVVVILRIIFIMIALILFQWSLLISLLTVVVGTAAFWFFTRSCWIVRLSHILFRDKRVEINGSQCRAKIDNWFVILISIFSWITFLTANFLLMKSAFGYTVAEAIPYIVYFGIAWIVGVISFILPAGIGIREITFIFLAQTFNQNQVVTVELLTAIAIVYRFWQILLEFGSLGIGFILSKIK